MIHCLLYILSEVLMNTSYALETENKNLKTTWGTSLEFGTFCCKQWVISFLFRVIAAGKSRRMDRLIQEREAALPLKPQMRQSPEELFKVNRAFVSGDGFSPVHSFDFLLHCCTWVLWYTKTFFMNSPFFPPFFVFVSSTFHCIWALALDKTISFFVKWGKNKYFYYTNITNYDQDGGMVACSSHYGFKNMEILSRLACFFGCF